MKYKAEVTFHGAGGVLIERSRNLNTLEKAVSAIESWVEGKMPARAWINNREVRLSLDGKAVGSDNQPFCTNEAWHDIFAPEHYPRVMPATRAQVKLAGRG